MTASYVYDERNQLIRENSKSQDKTFVYAYDAGGNLTSIQEYAYTTGALGSVVKTITGTYSSTWKDQLTKWNGEAITYDAIGNMLTHGDTSYTWTQGRKLASVVKNGVTSEYLYDHTGMRVSKTVDGVETRYLYAGRLLMSQKTTEGDMLFFRYDSASNLISMTCNSKLYFYVKNLQGDIIGLVNTAGKMVAEYKYDAWGKVLEISGSLASTIGKKNPFRYRGYYYDSETEMYYLQSRYYDPEVKRFINADDIGVLFENQDSLLQYNQYVYCLNDPVSRVDESGCLSIPNWAKVVIGTVAIAVGVAATALTGGAVLPALMGTLKLVTVGTVIGASVGATKHLVKEKTVTGIGKSILSGATTGYMVGGLVAGGMQAGRVALTKSGSGISLGTKKNIEMFYHTPKTKGGTIFSVKKKLVKPQRTYRFRLDLDIENGLHFHSGIGKAAKTHHRILPWLF